MRCISVTLLLLLLLADTEPKKVRRRRYEAALGTVGVDRLSSDLARRTTADRRKKKKKKMHKSHEHGSDVRMLRQLFHCQSTCAVQQLSSQSNGVESVLSTIRHIVPNLHYPSYISDIDDLIALGHIYRQLSQPTEALVIFSTVLQTLLDIWVEETASGSTSQCAADLSKLTSKVHIPYVLDAGSALQDCLLRCKSSPSGDRPRLARANASLWTSALRPPCATMEGGVHPIAGPLLALIDIEHAEGMSAQEHLTDTLNLSLSVMVHIWMSSPQSPADSALLADAFERRASLHIDKDPSLSVASRDLFTAEAIRLGIASWFDGAENQNCVAEIRLRRARVLMARGQRRAAVGVLESILRDSLTSLDDSVLSFIYSEMGKLYAALNEAEYTLSVYAMSLIAHTQKETLFTIAKLQFDMGRTDLAVSSLEEVLVSCRLPEESGGDDTRIREELYNLNQDSGTVIIDLRVFYHSVHHCQWSLKTLHTAHYLLAEWYQELGWSNRVYVHAASAFVIGMRDNDQPDYFAAMMAADALHETGQYSGARAINRYLLARNQIPLIHTHLKARQALAMRRLQHAYLTDDSKGDLIVSHAAQTSLLEYWFQPERLRALVDADDTELLGEGSQENLDEASFNFNHKTVLFELPKCNLLNDQRKYESMVSLVRGSHDASLFAQRNQSSGFHGHRRKLLGFRLGVVEMSQQLVHSAPLDLHTLTWRGWFNSGVRWRRLAQPSDRVCWTDDLSVKYRAYLGGLSTAFFNFGSYNNKYRAYISRAVTLVLIGLAGPAGFRRGSLHVARSVETSSHDEVGVRDTDHSIVPTEAQRDVIAKILFHLRSDASADEALKALYAALQALNVEGSSGHRFLYILDAKLDDSGVYQPAAGAILEIVVKPSDEGHMVNLSEPYATLMKLGTQHGAAPADDCLDRLKLSIVLPFNVSRTAILSNYMTSSFEELLNVIRSMHVDEANMIVAKKRVLHSALSVVFYWYQLNPLNRGSAMLGYMALAAAMRAVGLKANANSEVMVNTQMDLEAAFSSDVTAFRNRIRSTIDTGNWLSRTDRGYEQGPRLSDIIRTEEDIVDVYNCPYLYDM